IPSQIEEATMVTKASDARPNEALYNLRAVAGQSQQEVADGLNVLAARAGKATGVNANQISRWERGTVQPHPIYRRLLAEHFRVPVYDLGVTVRDSASRRVESKTSMHIASISASAMGEQPPAAVSTGWFRTGQLAQSSRIAICGSRSPSSDDKKIDASIIAVS